MTFTLPKDVLTWRDRVREFVEDEFIAWEVHAELNAGEIPADAAARHRPIAREMGLSGMDAPKGRGGLALSVASQVAIWEQLGRATNALGWCFSEAHRWMFEACNEDQIERYVLPVMRGERHECYAITEAESGSDVDGIRPTAPMCSCSCTRTPTASSLCEPRRSPTPTPTITRPSGSPTFSSRPRT
jgi:alkylation response protein AidB-like acyl-CoA dehydrogenase